MTVKSPETIFCFCSTSYLPLLTKRHVVALAFVCVFSFFFFPSMFCFLLAEEFYKLHHLCTLMDLPIKRFYDQKDPVPQLVFVTEQAAHKHQMGKKSFLKVNRRGSFSFFFLVYQATTNSKQGICLYRVSL